LGDDFNISQLIDYRVYKGLIVSNDGTKVEGNFQYADFEFPDGDSSVIDLHPPSE
jgi:hypothetical protein